MYLVLLQLAALEEGEREATVGAHIFVSAMHSTVCWGGVTEVTVLMMLGQGERALFLLRIYSVRVQEKIVYSREGLLARMVDVFLACLFSVLV